ncbi:LapA family protein [Sphingomonas cannabina]|uniref:LapA family protein n=1 Tax=Sphingomonas cannabina TaxID=2899123 RepID=UPI001F273A1C|nr:LapA family protein [Sphingomonas cannabina]UIJ43963.1 LapA family protein [Sphingomonas cannabina]
MQFLKTLLIVLMVGLGVAFAINNWTTVPLALWGGLVADVNLPLLMLVCFLAGLVPMWLAWLTTRWRLRNRLATTERTVADLRQATATPPPPPPVAEESASPLPGTLL